MLKCIKSETNREDNITGQSEMRAVSQGGTQPRVKNLTANEEIGPKRKENIKSVCFEICRFTHLSKASNSLVLYSIFM